MLYVRVIDSPLQFVGLWVAYDSEILRRGLVPEVNYTNDNSKLLSVLLE